MSRSVGIRRRGGDGVAEGGEAVAEGGDEVKEEGVGVDEGAVVGGGEGFSDFAGPFDPLELDVGRVHVLADELSGGALTLGADDGALLVLKGLFDEELGAFGVLLGGLLGFDGLVELLREGEMGLPSQNPSYD